MLTTEPVEDYSTATHGRDRIIGILNKYNLSFREVDDYDVSAIEIRSQVRSDKHVAPVERVKMFADCMRRGESIPPGVVTNDAFPLDGNTRIAAAHKIARNKLPMFVLDMNYDDKEGLMTALGCELNSGQSQDLDKEGKRNNAITLIRVGYKNEKIANIVGMDSSTIMAYRQEVQAIDKLQKLKLAKNGNPKALRALGRAADLHDTPFAELAKLATEAGLNAKEIADITKRLRGAASDEAMMDILKNERATLAGAIHEMKIKGAVKSRPSRNIKRTLGGIVKYAGSELSSLLETQPESAAEYMKDVREAIAVLQRILDGQEQIAKAA